MFIIWVWNHLARNRCSEVLIAKYLSLSFRDCVSATQFLYVETVYPQSYDVGVVRNGGNAALGSFMECRL